MTEVTTDDYGLTKMAYVKPAANFSLLETVMILRRSVTTVDGIDASGANADITIGTSDEEGERETKILKTAEETGAVSLPTQFAQINLPAAAPELSQADVVLHYNDWSIELRNSVSPVLLNRIMQMVMKHV